MERIRGLGWVGQLPKKWFPYNPVFILSKNGITLEHLLLPSWYPLTNFPPHQMLSGSSRLLSPALRYSLRHHRQCVAKPSLL